MTNIDTILREIKTTMDDGVREAIADHCVDYSQEFQYGTAFIGVELVKDGQTDVWVAHEDARHRSPRIIEKVLDVLPDWWEIESEVERELEYSYQDDFEVFGLYN